ncbi:caspase family protein [Sulfurimonas sp.]|uniref:caspase family protein n=1 Tax=Sulfurimonas sp. TaxID=2022749 RepID=UPI002AAF7658|nr:caspase family protein [Sulfurimonas sp.]
MKKIIFLIIVWVNLFSQTGAILKLDTKGHTGLIKDIIISRDESEIITASDDKTIRVWDAVSGVEKRKILGQIGSGSEGMIFAMALSPYDKYLAVGGYFDNTHASSNLKHGQIRIYDYQTGKIIKILKSHESVVFDLGFSSDGELLISGSDDDTAKIWDVSNNFSLKDTITFHKDAVKGVKIIKNGSSYFAITSGYDYKIALYDIQEQEIINSISIDKRLKYIATTNANGGHIAFTGKAKAIYIYDFDLELIKVIKSTNKPVGLAYSKDGKFLITGTGKSPRVVRVYDASNNYTTVSSFKKHNNTTIAVAFLNNKTAVSAGGNNSEIYIWDIKTRKVKRKISGVGQRVWSVGLKGNKIAWGTKPDISKTNKMSTFTKSINLKNFKISKDTRNFKRNITTNGSYSLKHIKGGDYGYNGGTLQIRKNGKIKKTITKNSTNGFRHRCYGWYKDYIISGGNNGDLRVYNKQGENVATLVGHTSTVWSISIDGDRLVSGSGDQTIKLWDLSKLDEMKGSLVKLSWFSTKWHKWISKNYPNYKLQNERDVRRFYNKLIENNDNNNAKKLIAKTKILEPILNIFVSKDNEWVAWTKSGYFNSSVGGDKYVGYHINQGANKEARYVGSDKYFNTLYRPDIISLAIQTGSEKKAIAYASRTKKVKTINIQESLPPVISLLSNSNIRTNKKAITIKFSVDSDKPIKDIIILHNGERLSKRGIKRKQSNNYKSITIELDSGENIISIKARNKFAMSDEVLVYATKTSKTKNIYKPTLYMLSIGVSKYKNPEYNLGVADKDAKAMAKMFKKQEGKIYKKVVVKTLINKQAHSDNILDGLDWIDKEATSKDVVIIFIAGHGVNDEKGSYYFLSHDANLDKLRRTAVKWIEIEDTISNLPSKVILLADTCHSGNITGTRRDITSAIKSIINSGSGSIIMTATTGSGYSYEKKEWGHGAFTKSFIDGLDKMKADYDNDGTVTIKEIDLYITTRVKKLTNGKQKPTTIMPRSVPDFAIGVR